METLQILQCKHLNEQYGILTFNEKYFVIFIVDIMTTVYAGKLPLT